MRTLGKDVAYAVRMLAKSPGFSLAAILSLAIGIGANTSIFCILDALLLRPLPYQDAGRLVILWNRSPGLNITEDWFSTAQYFDIKTGHHGFEQVAIAIGGNDNLTSHGEPERVGTIRISSNLLPMLGQSAALGRTFSADEDSPGRPATALLSHGMWERHYGADPRIIGQSVTLNGLPYEVVGIMPPSFSLPREVLPTLGGAEQADILLPLPLPAEAAQNRDHEDYNIMGKLKPGVSTAQAQAEMDTITARLRHDHPQTYPPNGGLTFGIVPLLEQVVGDARPALFVLLGAVGFVLVIACANVANLLLARAVARQKEIAIRTALGASRWRIVQQLLTESVLLSLCGGALGVLLALWSLHWIQILGPKSVPRIHDIGIDSAALLFTFLLSLGSGTLFGLAPALRISRLNVNATLQDASRGSAGTSAVWGRGNHLRRLLVVAELALCVMVLIGAGLLIRSFGRLQHVSPGFNARNVLTLELTLNGPKYKDPQAVLATYRDLWKRVEALPGVTASGGVTALPMSQMFEWGPITVEGRVLPPGENFINADQHMVSGHYFSAMEIPLRSGRFFNQQDNTTSPKVVIVDEYMARQLWPDRNPIGQRIHYGGLSDNEPWETVVGVVGRVKQYTLDADSRIALYRPQTQYPTGTMNVVLRTGTDRTGIDPATLTSAVKRQIRALDSDLPLYNVRTMEQRMEESLARRRFSMLLLALFACVALALATIGTYGVMAYLVNQGTREIGIRIALGATQMGIVRLVVWKGMALALSGVAVGLAGALALSRLMRSLLFGVSPADPLTFVAISFLLAFVTLLASYIQAHRAAHIDPIVSLRYE
jgi:putative ABC transport system permease protein